MFLTPKHLAIALLAALTTLPAHAAGVTVYGRVDTGLIYQNFFGDSTKKDNLTMGSGPNTASRWGIQGKEVINPDWTVGFRLEGRFASDTGELKGDRLFEGSSFINVINQHLGEVAVGRIAGLASASGPYDHQFYMDAFAGGTYGTALAPIKSSRMDNMITYRTPMMAGWQVTLQHSLKLSATDIKDLGEEGEASANRFWAAGARYQVGGLNVVATYEGTTWGHDSLTGADHNRQVFSLGGNYRTGDVAFYVQGQLFKGVEKLDGMSANDLKSQLSGYGFYAGTQVWFGLSSWQTMVYWRDYKLKNSTTRVDTDASSLGIGTKYLYRPSKTIELYVGAGLAQWDRLGTNGEVLTDKTFNAFTGVTKYF